MRHDPRRHPLVPRRHLEPRRQVRVDHTLHGEEDVGVRHALIKARAVRSAPMTIDGTASATELAAAIRRKQVSSRELLDLFVDRIDRLDGKVNAVVTLDLERAREAATAADDATARGDRLGPLHGLPVTIKDAIATAGIRSTGGAIELTDNVPTEDATVVSSIKAAGAIVFGKTNLPRWSGDL